MNYGFAVYTPYKRNSLSTYPINVERNKKVVEMSTYKKEENSPINVFVSLVSKELDFILENDKSLKVKNACTCNSCRNKVIKIALRNLPPVYLNNKSNIESKVTAAYNRYRDLIEDMVSKAQKKVYRNPSSNCESVMKNKIDFLVAA